MTFEMQNGVEQFDCAVVTLSDKGSAGLRKDTSGDTLQKILKDEGYSIKEYKILPDIEDQIVETLIDLVDNKGIDLIVTTGGTGVSPSDVTPEAMLRVIEKQVPGMAEAMRFESLKKTVHAVISRGIVGIRKKSLIINLPGSERAARENIEVLLPALPHAISKIKGSKSDCGTI